VGRLGNISGKEAVKAGPPSGKSVVIWCWSSPASSANLSVPQHKELSVGTLRALIRNAGMTIEEFLALL
jgi:hypothetical protein